MRTKYKIVTLGRRGVDDGSTSRSSPVAPAQSTTETAKDRDADAPSRHDLAPRHGGAVDVLAW